MNLKDLVSLYAEMGLKTFSTRNASWLIRPSKVAYSLPMQENCYPEAEDFTELFGLGVRVALYKSDTVPNNTFEYVFEGNRYQLGMFDSKIRNQIRKGLKSCIVQDAPLNVLVEQAYQINVKTLEHQKRSAPHLGNKKQWERYISALYKKNDVFIKGAFAESKLLAYAVILKINGTFIVEHPYIDREASALNPMNAILYTFINDAISNQGSVDISYGMASFAEIAGLDKFKTGMLFKKRECGRGIAVNARYKILFNPLMRSFAWSLAKMKFISQRQYDHYRLLSSSSFV